MARKALLVFLAALPLIAGAACGDDTELADPPPSAAPDASAAQPNDAPAPPAFGLDTRPSNTTCLAPPRPTSTTNVKFERVFANTQLAGVMAMSQPPGDPSRWFVALREGKIVSFDASTPPATPAVVADVGALAGGTVAATGEGGLLGMAFHPKFSTNGRLYVSWVAQGGPLTSALGYLSSTTGGASFASYTPTLAFGRNNATHCGGSVLFGHDGYLYASFGDDDNDANGQKTTGFHAKVLRLDVDAPASYAVPASNPFAAGGGEAATFAYGFRNPYRMSIDRATGDLWVADVGYHDYEEIDRVRIGGNYGWPCREGMHDRITPTIDATRCPSLVGLAEPVAEQAHTPALPSRAIIGGVVYRGSTIPSFVGTYIFGDWVLQELWALSFDPSTAQPVLTQLNPTGNPYARWNGFAEDLAGEIYAFSDDAIYKLMPAAPPPASTFPDRLSKTGCVDPANPGALAAGVIPYAINAPLWSDGAEKQRWLALPDSTTIGVGADGDFDLPIGSVLGKTFSIGGTRVETRLFMRHDDGAWGGYTYEWLDDQSDAVLLPSSKVKSVGLQRWYYPSRSDCLQCHTAEAGRSLGLELAQLNRDTTYPATGRTANQLTTLEHIGLFAAPLGRSAAEILAYPDPAGSGPTEGRARAYLHANCSSCHRPNSVGLGSMDLRFATPFAETKTCNVNPTRGDLGIVGAKLLVPGVPASSLLSVRTHAAQGARMPPLASGVVDTSGVALLDDWIRSLAACP